MVAAVGDGGDGGLDVAVDTAARRDSGRRVLREQARERRMAMQVPEGWRRAKRESIASKVALEWRLRAQDKLEGRHTTVRALHLRSRALNQADRPRDGACFAAEPPASLSMTPQSLRALYRRLLRELPSPTPRHKLSHPSPVQRRIRSSIADAQSPALGSVQAQDRIDRAEQLVRYVRAKNTYEALLKRYNPGIAMSEKERLRLTARRVGLHMPEQADGDADGDASGGSTR